MTPHDPQDRAWWIKFGTKKEGDFIKHICPSLGLDACANPQKIVNPRVPDLLVNGRIADLKYQTTPFFYARKLFNIDPRYAVALNHKDLVYYNERYPYIDIYFWLHWRVTRKRIGKAIYRIRPLRGVWRASLREINNLVSLGKAHLHEYKMRRGNKHGNAPDSYMMDVRNFTRITKAGIKMRRCYIDLETSGVEPGKSVILALGAVMDSGEEFYTLIKPTKDEWALASPEALKINGITWDMLAGAPPLSKVRQMFSDFLCDHRVFRGEAVFVGQNISFDLRFLEHFMGSALRDIGAPLGDCQDVMVRYLRSTWLGFVPFTWNLKGHTISKALNVEEESEVHNALEGARVVKRNMEALDLALGMPKNQETNLDD